MKYSKSVHDAIIRELHLGKENAVKSDMLANVIGIQSRTNEVVREIVREMVEELGYCIGSHTGGFYLINDESDLESTAANLKARAISMLNRRKILIKNFQHQRNLVL